MRCRCVEYCAIKSAENVSGEIAIGHVMADRMLLNADRGRYDERRVSPFARTSSMSREG